MSFEHISAPISAILSGLAEKIAENKAKASSAADKIGTADHHKTLGHMHELHAEQAQKLAREELAWHRLVRDGFVRACA